MKKLKGILFIVLPFLMVSSCNNEPLDPDFAEENTDTSNCLEAIEAYQTAAMNIVDATDANYTALCNAYKVSLENAIDTCGDPTGGFQTLITSLGDCSSNDPGTCDSATAAAGVAADVFTNAPDANYTNSCNVYKAALENQIILCGDLDGSIQATIDGLGDCTLITGGEEFALMTANLDGEQFDDLKPNGYNLTQNAIGVINFTGDPTKYIRVQGNSTYPNINSTVFTKEITFFIPEPTWAVGTYTISEFQDPTMIHCSFIYFNDDEYTFGSDIPGGTITITQFDTVTRIIEGTFSFQYERESNVDSTVIGPFECTNGTFKYSLDDPYFD